MGTLQSPQRFIAVAVALFLGSAAVTVAQCEAMMPLHDLSMCSGRMAAATMHDAFGFVGMWSTMMMAMMLPSLMPVLLHYRRSVAAASQPDALTLFVGLGYFAVWTAAGLFAFVASMLLSTAQTGFVGAVVLIAGVLQFTRWKAHHLTCCRVAPACCDMHPANAWTAWRRGLRLGRHCVHCCFGLTLVLLVAGMMDWRAMALVTAAISVERLAPGGLRAARLVGVVLVAMGVFLSAHATTT
jgi:predicted metal-binding membrane protein